MGPKRLGCTLLSVFLLLPFSKTSRAAGPKVQIFEDVEKGLEVGLQVGVGYNFNPPVEKPGLGMLTGVELGYDLTWVFRVKCGFLTNNYNAAATTQSGEVLPMDFQQRLFWGGASLSLLATQRFYLYLQAGAGYLDSAPKKVREVVVAPPSDVAVLAGGGLEYYPKLRHISFAVEVNAMVLPGRQEVSLAAFSVLRFTFGLGQARVIKPPEDRDHDGVLDEKDKCPDVWGVESNQGCPEPDTDGDGVIDREDRCPEEPGPASNAGCPIPPDTDNDGVPDKVDRCPKEPGPKEKEGCPDRDDDGIPDYIDKCPDKKGTLENDGCPSKAEVKVRVRKESIELREKIHFEFGKAIIKTKSHPLLDQVVATLKQHPEIKKLRVEGHTDNKGAPAYNLRLSQKRAQAVVDYLINQGIDRDRLMAQGFGETRPIAANQTEPGRSMNRRVEMIILEQE